MTSPPAPEFLALQQALAGRFSLERELGRGGMGIVFLARDVALDRPVAIKLLPPESSRDPATRERFLREARTAAGLSHPNVVPIHLVEQQGDLVFFVMSYVHGETLGERVRRTGPLDPATGARIIREVAWALAYAHGRGVIHRDVKPDNILLEQGSGRALVTDFGIARLATQDTVSGVGEIVGTVQYMSPEQADPAARLDGRSDLYALGVTAFFAMTGRLPFEAPSAVALLAMHMTAPAPPVASVRPDLPAALAGAIDRCLAKKPDERFARGEELASAIEGALGTARPVALSVRRFQDAAISSAQQLSLLGSLWVFSSMLAPEVWQAQSALVALLTVIPVFSLVGAARGVARDGLGTADVAEAYRTMAVVPGRGEDKARRDLIESVQRSGSPLFRVLTGAIGAVALFVGIDGLLGIEGWEYPSPVQVALNSLLVTGMGVFFLVVALRIGPFKDPLLRLLQGSGKPRFEFLAKLAEGRLARWLFRIARIGLGKDALPAAPSRQPTELVLANAIDEMFAGLSSPQRRALAHVPQAVRRLERLAEALRAQLDQLSGALDQAASVMGAADNREIVTAEIGARRTAVAERHAMTVKALENLRLDLLRLRAGVATQDDLTATLEAASRIGDEVDAILGAEAAARGGSS